MELEKLINDDIKQTMLARDNRKLEALRAIKAALLLEKTGKDLNWNGEIPEEVELKLLQKLVKMRRESAELYKAQNRPDLVEEELFQASIIEKYLPAQMDEAEIEATVKSVINQTGAQTMKDMGKVMGIASKTLAGKADNKTLSEIVKRLLGS
ncbi:MAG TPA: GatB/YqeY domain-containing protein [Bacteroidales bacterium]|nr:GatB/YqeY domain-containing protein [Bacteroidales bacterium]